MAPATSACPKCQSTMEKGFVTDLTYGAAMQSAWTPGDPRPRRFFGGIQWRRSGNIPITTLRCPNCGYLESYALLPSRVSAES